MVTNFRKLNIWQRSRILVSDVYNLSRDFPKNEKYALVSQIQRSAISIPSNIAEGSGRRTKKDFSRFIDIAIASSCELETQLFLAYDLNFLEFCKVEKIIIEIEGIRKMMFVYQAKLLD